MTTLFDPLGFISPYIICVKVILQELWTYRLDWDDPIPKEIDKQVNESFEELRDLPDIKVQRCIKADSKVREHELHVFTDASSEAYEAVVYQRTVYADGEVSTRFVISKLRVSPLKSISIPRMELLAAVLGLKLAERSTMH